MATQKELYELLLKESGLEPEVKQKDFYDLILKEAGLEPKTKKVNTVVRKLNKNKEPYYVDITTNKKTSLEKFASQYDRLPPRATKEFTKKEKKTFAENRVVKNFTPEKVQRKSKGKRIRIKGKFISSKIENTLREFAANNKMSLSKYIKENKEAIENYLTDFKVINNYRPDTVITMINLHKGKLNVKGFEGKNKKEIIRAITKLSNKLNSEFGTDLYFIEIRTSLQTKGNNLEIDLSDISDILKMDYEELSDFDSSNIIIHLGGSTDKYL